MSKLGQYFTTNLELQNKVYNFILNNPKNILEPSIGKGHLIECILSKKKEITFDMYEIDETLNFLKCINKSKIHFGNFLKQKIDKKFTTIIGNPPYVRTKKGNLYIDFIEKCVELLDSNGELIFIIPSDFFKLTSASKLLTKMISQGNFTHIYHPNNEKLFENASIDVLIFRYVKNTKIDSLVLYNNEKKYVQHKNGIITFTKHQDTTKNHISLSELFDIYVGMVTGKDEVFKNKKFGNISLLSGKEKMEKYIYIKEFPDSNEELNKYFLENKEKLINRKIKKFNEKNWFEWGAMRNKTKIEQKLDKPCIYIHNLTRKKEVAFSGKVMYFTGNLLVLIPKKNLNLEKIVDYLNCDDFKENFMFSNRFKIGHKQLCNVMIPEDI
jgi:adenine-specific DNA-methyltransferase